LHLNRRLLHLSTVRHTRKRTGTESVFRPFDRPCGEHRQSINQLINWRMCKKHQMGWGRAGAQQLLHVKTAIINGRLDRYIGHHSVPADIAALPPGFYRSYLFAALQPERPRISDLLRAVETECQQRGRGRIPCAAALEKRSPQITAIWPKAISATNYSAPTLPYRTT
jgi:hypothetical protein